MADGTRATSLATIADFSYVLGIDSSDSVGRLSSTALSTILAASGALADAIAANTSDISDLQSVGVTGYAFTDDGPVACATTANITLSGEQTIDGVLTSTDRILVKDQTDASENGIYVTAAGAWSRATDMDAAGEVVSTGVRVAGGTANGGRVFVTYSVVTTLDTDDINFVDVGDISGAQDQIDTLDGRADTLEDNENIYFISFDQRPILDVPNGVIKYSSGFYRRKSGGSVVTFDPANIGETHFEAPISGSVSGGVMHYWDTAVDASALNPISASGSGVVIGVDPTLIPLGIWKDHEWTPINTGPLLDLRRAGADYPNIWVQRPMVLDLYDTLGRGDPTLYIPRNIYLSYRGETITNVALANTLVEDLAGGYCAITMSRSDNVDVASAQAVYLDLADDTAKRVTGSTAPTTDGPWQFLPLLTTSGVPGVWRSPSGIPVKELFPKYGEEVLADLMASLVSPLRSTHVDVISDSIGWGMNASDIGPKTPRTGELTDTRDVITSGSFANKLRRWCAGMACGGRNESEPAPGESLHEHTVYGVPYTDGDFTVLDTNGKVTVKSGGINANALHKSYLDVPDGVGNKLAFYFTGEEFTIWYATQVDDDWTVEVDGVEVASHTSGGGAAWGQTEAVTGLTFGPHKVEIINASASTNIRLEAIEFTKTMRFTNNGIIGSHTAEWLPAGTLLDDGVPDGTTHLFIQLGTNDRSQAETSTLPENEERTAINLRAIVEWLQTNRPDMLITLMAPPMATSTQDEQGDGATFNYSTDDLMRTIRRLAEDMKVGFIDNYSVTKLESIDGNSFLDDNLHPNDAGHTVIYRNIVGALVDASRQ